MSYKAINPDKPEGEMTIELPKPKPGIQGYLSLDVNHGFAIYSPSKQIVVRKLPKAMRDM